MSDATPAASGTKTWTVPVPSAAGRWQLALQDCNDQLAAARERIAALEDECRQREKYGLALATRIHAPVTGYEARITALEAERDALRDKCDELFDHLREANLEPRRLRAEIERLTRERGELRAALKNVHELADDELRRVGAVPGSNIAQIEADAAAALAPTPGKPG